MNKLLACCLISLLGILGFIVTLGFAIPLLSKILFYRGLELILIILFIYAAMCFLASKSNIYNKYIGVFFAAGCISFAVNTSFLIVVPVTLDRSISIFLLGDLYNKGGKSSSEQLRIDFVDIYVDKYAAIDRRLEEQIKSGNVLVTDDGEYQLTTRGSMFIRLSRGFASFMAIDDKFVNPK